MHDKMQLNLISKEYLSNYKNRTWLECGASPSLKLVSDTLLDKARNAKKIWNLEGFCINVLYFMSVSHHHVTQSYSCLSTSQYNTYFATS